MNTLTTSSNVNYIGSNIWTNLVMVIDKDDNKLHVYQDGTLIESLDIQDTISSTTSNMFIGKNDDIYFKGNMDDIRVYNREFTSNDVELLYNTKQNDKLMLQYDFEHYTNNSNIYDESGYINEAILQNPSSSNLFDDSTKTISNTSLNTHHTISEFYQIASNNIVLGSNLNNCTFSAWVKTDQLNSFEPIISREGIFSFGLNYGHACLRLGNDTSLIGLPSIQTASNSESSVEDSLKNDLMHHVHFDSEQSGVTRSNAPTTSLTDVVYDGGSALTLNSNNNQFVQLDGSQFASTNVNDAFSFSGWVKFDDVSGEMPIFKRGDDNIKFSLSNNELLLSLKNGEPVKLLSNTLTSDNYSFSQPDSTLSNINNSKMGGAYYEMWHMMDGTKWSGSGGASDVYNTTPAHIGFLSAQGVDFDDHGKIRATNSFVIDLTESRTLSEIRFWNYWAKDDYHESSQVADVTLDGVTYTYPYSSTRRTDIMDVYISDNPNVPEDDTNLTTLIVSETGKALSHTWVSTPSVSASGRYVRFNIQNNTGWTNGENVVGLFEIELFGN